MNAVCQFFRNNYILASCEEVINNKAFVLNLSHFQMSEVPSLIEKCETLMKLFLNQNNLTCVPPAVGNLIRLQVLTLDYNQLKAFPLHICRLANLRFLNLSCNNITELPSEIGNLTVLETFWCNNTGLESLPDEICNCEKLETLGVRGNRIRSLPSGIGTLKQLRWLTLDTNELEEVPIELALLDKLVHLNLKSNRLTKVPRELITLTKLQFVFLNNNCIDELPKRELLIELRKLRMLNLCGNPISKTHELQLWAQVQTNIYVEMESDDVTSAESESAERATAGGAGEHRQAGVDERNSSSDWANSVKTSELDTTDESNLETNLEDISMLLPELARFITNF